MIRFRKIASVVASALMIGSTMGAALAANYPAPFVSGGVADVAIVYGSNAAISDLSAAIDVQTNLNSKVTSSSGTGASTTGGNSVSLASSSQQMLMNSTLSVARSIITKDHLPTLLADGTALDSAGTEYKYTQTIVPGSGARKVTFGKSSESIDPIMMIDLGTSAGTAPVFNYTLTFSKSINVSDTTNVVGTAEINILGNKYIIGANSDSNTLYLYGSGETATVEEGETKTVTINDKEHTMSLVLTSSTTTASIEVDGVSKSVTKGNSYKFADGFEIYVKEIAHAIKTGTLSKIDLLAGSKSLHFQSGQAARVGSDDNSILGTVVDVVGTAGAGVNRISITQAAESSLGDYLKAGESYTDRIFGNLVLDFVGVVPTLDSETRDSIVIDTDNAVAARVKFTPAASGSKEYTLTYARDSDGLADSALARVDLAYDSNLNMSIQEGENMKINQYIMANDNDDGRIFQVVFLPSGTNVNDYARLRDVISGIDYDFTTGINNKTTAAKTIVGAEYHLAMNQTGGSGSQDTWTMNLTWGEGSAAGNPGTQTTLFPRIKLANGEWIAFLANTAVTRGVTYQLPGNYLLTTYKTGSTLAWGNNSDTPTVNTTTLGSVVYNVTWTANLTTGTLNSVLLNSNLCNFNNTMGPAILVVEEKTLADADGDSICIPLVTQGTNPKMPAIGTPVFSDGVATLSGNNLQSNTYKSQAVDLYGTLVERDTATGTNYMVTISYPNEQMYADVFFKESGTSITPGTEGTSGSGTVMIVKDSEIDSVKDKNLLVIGGSCVNSVARKIVDPDATSPICGADFTSKTNVGAGQYLLKAVASPYNAKKTAMLVAGYEAAQTVSAVSKLKETHATDIDTEKVYPITSA